MSTTPTEREYFLDSIRAWLMLLGIPFHISLIYSSHTWHVNSQMPSWWLTLFNDFIHAFRMQVFFVISGYFSYMLFLRYPLKRWWKVRVERVGIPMLTAIPLLTLPQFIMLQYVKGKAENWPNLSLYEKYNTLVWELVSHLWFLLVLVVLTTVSLFIFSRLRHHLSSRADAFFATVTLGKLSVLFLLLGIAYAAVRRILFIVYPPILSDGLFNFVVMQSLFYIPFFLIGALAFIYPKLKALFTTPSPWCAVGAAIAFAAYLLNQRYGSGDAWMYETESVITMLLGLWMVNVVFALGHRLLNRHAAARREMERGEVQLLELFVIKQRVKQGIYPGHGGERVFCQLFHQPRNITRVSNQHVLTAELNKQQAVHGERKDVIQRKRGDHHLFARMQQRPVGGIDLLKVRQHVAVGQHCAFRHAGGTAGILQEREIF